MRKWYEEEATDKGIVISSRVRLARNVKQYPFSVKIKDEQVREMIDHVSGCIVNSPQLSNIHYMEMQKLNRNDKRALMERHVISPALWTKQQLCGVLLSEDCRTSVMLNEEDHIRIQTVEAGEDIERAYLAADEIDNILEEKLEIAFDEQYGYLTTCPTNVGTGLRASFMMHLPALTFMGQIKGVIRAISKFGITVRGIYGEGSEALGSVYQISNQMTLGQSEGEIVSNLKNIVGQVSEQEIKAKEKILQEEHTEFEDRVYRSYGILENARTIKAKEAMEYLSNIREGYITGVLRKPKPKSSVYALMMNVQPGNVQSQFDSELPKEHRRRLRADYLREQMKSLN